jgi:hypothetical protein
VFLFFLQSVMSSKPHATTRSAAAAGRSLFRSEEAANVPSSKVVSGPYSSQSLAKHNSGCPPVKGIKHQAEGSVGFEDDLASSIDGGLASSAVSRTHDGGLASSAVSRTHGGEDVASHMAILRPVTIMRQTTVSRQLMLICKPQEVAQLTVNPSRRD